MNVKLNHRKATVSDCPLLSKLSCDSEAYWKYCEEFLEIFKEKYNVTEKFIQDNIVYKLESETDIIGFYGIIQGNNIAELEFFYISVDYIGKGYGRELWNHMISQCRKDGILEFEFVTSPQAVKFYEKMGARLIGETQSLIDGRAIPKLLYTLY